MTLNASEEKRVREIIEYQVKQLDAIYKITCSSKDYAEWKSPGLSEEQLQAIEKKLGIQLPEEQRIALGVFEFRISPIYELDAGFSDGFVPINNMCLASDFVLGDEKIKGIIESISDILPEKPKYFGALHHVPWHKDTIWIGADDTFHWFVDLKPPSGGTYGQIICVGLEEIRVVAKSYIEFLEIIIKSFQEDEFM